MKILLLITILATLNGCATMREHDITAMDVLMIMVAMKASGVVDDSYSDIDRWNYQYQQNIINRRLNDTK